MEQKNNRRKNGAVKIRLKDFELLDQRYKTYYKACEEIVRKNGACSDVACLICPFGNSEHRCVDYASSFSDEHVDNILVDSSKKLMKKLIKKYGLKKEKKESLSKGVNEDGVYKL